MPKQQDNLRVIERCLDALDRAFMDEVGLGAFSEICVVTVAHLKN
jgi:hypothetical protein